MKYSLLFLVLLIAGCRNSIQTKQINLSVSETPIYHIKVVPFGRFAGTYCIHYTNNNWKDFADIYECFDISLEHFENVRWQTMLFDEFSGGCEAAIELAKTLTTYEKCQQFNDSTLKECNRLRQYYLIHPKQKQNPVISNCQLSTNIY